MVQLTLDDLMRWSPVRFRASGSPANLREMLAVELSWAVTIRASAPVLPPIRGGELVLLPAEVLRELRERESIGLRQVLEQLAVLPVAGVLTDDTSIGATSSGLITLESTSMLPEELESLLNREIIERRGELYQLGSELARELSAASIRGASLETLLDIAGSIGELPVALVAGTGAVLAGARDGLLAGGLPFDPERLNLPFPYDGLDWVCHPVSSLALPPGVVLVGGIAPESAGDRARLILEQTAESLGMLFDRLPPVEAPTPQREIEQLLEQIVVHANITPVARRRFAHLVGEPQPSGELRLVIGADGSENQVRAPREMRFQHEGFDIRIVNAAEYQEMVAANAPVVASAAAHGIEGLAALLPPAMRAAGLMREKVFGVGIVDLGDATSGRAAVVLLMAGMASASVEQSLLAFADGRLASLDAYDRARGAELVRTLAAYLAAGATIAAAARALGIHRNTLAYRIDRIEEVGGLTLADPSTRFDLELAIMIRRVLKTGGS